MSKSVGVTEWVIAEGYIPPESHGPRPQMTSHETGPLAISACRGVARPSTVSNTRAEYERNRRPLRSPRFCTQLPA